MTERDNVSMATVQMKPDYAASEVYSTASEPPPLGLFNFTHQAYKRQANSVKIAKITAFTIIVSSFILGAFLLASSYLQAKASCDQVQALDSVLEKELMLETLQQVNKELPRAEALLGKENTDETDLQNLDKEGAASVKKSGNKESEAVIPIVNVALETNDNNDNSYSDSDETEEMQKLPGKLPLELDLSDLAATILRNNKRSRMNCVVERKHAEEIVDSPPKTVALPFGVNLTTEPKKARITGERISIFCDGGEDSKEQELKNINRESDAGEDAEPLRPMFIPYQRLPVPFGRIPQQFPLTHMPQRMMPPAIQQQTPQTQQPLIRQLPPPFQQLPMRPPMPPQVMQAPRIETQPLNEPHQHTVRIHVQQIPFREIHVADDVPVQIPPQQQEVPQFQIQRMPLGLALQRAGITAEDLRNIQRMAEDRITDELRRLAIEEAAESAENSSNSSEEDVSSNASSSVHNSQEQEQPQSQQQHSEQHSPQEQQQQESQHQQDQSEQRIEEVPIQRLVLQPLPEQPQMQYGRAAFGRSLAQPVRIPVPMMMAQADMSPESSSSVSEELERPHFVQPRST